MENLETKSVKDLETLCKKYGIHYYKNKRHLRKDEMIEEINKCSENKEETLAKDFSKRKKYVENVEAGKIIAFVDYYGKARTAKVDENKKSDSLIIATTEFGRTFKIPYDSILWVRDESNPRWPKGVYQMLKGITV